MLRAPCLDVGWEFGHYPGRAGVSPDEVALNGQPSLSRFQPWPGMQTQESRGKETIVARLPSSGMWTIIMAGCAYRARRIIERRTP